MHDKYAYEEFNIYVKYFHQNLSGKKAGNYILCMNHRKH